jgi:hypothetical protein
VKVVAERDAGQKRNAAAQHKAEHVFLHNCVIGTDLEPSV